MNRVPGRFSFPRPRGLIEPFLIFDQTEMEKRAKGRSEARELYSNSSSMLIAEIARYECLKKAEPWDGTARGNPDLSHFIVWIIFCF
jgi:hypothetical protein